MKFDAIKQQLDAARKRQDKVEVSILSLILGEAQTIQFRKGHAAITDEEVVKIIRKLIESNAETIGLSPDSIRKSELTRENEIMLTLLPKMASKDEFRDKLSKEMLSSAKNEGQAIGVAIKYLKSQGILAEAKDIIEVVKEIWNS